MKSINLQNTALLILSLLLILKECPAQIGVLDPAYGVNGIVSSSELQIIRGLIIQNNGKAVIAANGSSGSGLYRFNADGSTDSTFGVNGIATISIGLSFYSNNALAVHDDDKLIVAGDKFVAGAGSVFAVERFNSDGTVDSTFGDDGIAVTNTEAHYFNQVNVIFHQGKIIITGITIDQRLVLFRFNSNGELDNSFSGDGKLLFSAGSTADYFLAESLEVSPDEKIILCGRSFSDPAFLSINWNGTLNSSFGEEGCLKIDFSPFDPDAEYYEFTDLSIHSDGSISATSTGNNSPLCYIFVCRISSNGILDSTFGNNGIIALTDSFDFYSEFIIVEQDKKVLLGTFKTYSEISVKRFDSTGEPDSTFAVAGSTSINFGQVQYFRGIALQPDGNIIAVATKTSIEDTTFIMRYLSDGSLPTTASLIKTGNSFIYPNPADNIITLRNFDSYGPASVFIEDISGDILFRKEINFSLSQSTVTINIEDLHAGIYLVIIMSQDRKWYEKLIIF